MHTLATIYLLFPPLHTHSRSLSLSLANSSSSPHSIRIAQHMFICSSSKTFNTIIKHKNKKTTAKCMYVNVKKKRNKKQTAWSLIKIKIWEATRAAGRGGAEIVCRAWQRQTKCEMETTEIVALICRRLRCPLLPLLVLLLLLVLFFCFCCMHAKQQTETRGGGTRERDWFARHRGLLFFRGAVFFSAATDVK